MLQVKDENLKTPEVTLKLDPRQVGILAAYITQEGFDILQQVMEQEIRNLNIDLFNTPPGNRDEIIDKWAMSKSVAMWYAGVMKAIANICQVAYSNDQQTGTIDNPERIVLQREFE